MQLKARLYKQLLLLGFVLCCLSFTVKAQEKFRIWSSGFKTADTIPAKYSCEGKNILPPLQWSNAPKETKSFAIIMDDPDAPMGTWVHWVMYNISPSQQGLSEGAKAADAKATDGVNSWGDKGYNGPCPPDGTHNYSFTIYALDTTLRAAGLEKEGVLQAIKGHVLAQAELKGSYGRK